MERVTLFCFAASYAVALGLELWHHFRRRPVRRSRPAGADDLPRRAAPAAGLAVRPAAGAVLGPRRLLPLRLAPPQPPGLGHLRAAGRPGARAAGDAVRPADRLRGRARD